MNIDVSPELRNALGARSSAVLSARLRGQQECSVCGERLGETMAAISAQSVLGPSYEERWMLSVHHRRCGRSELTRSGIYRVGSQTQYAGVTFLVPGARGEPRPRRRLMRRRHIERDEGRPTMAPVCLVNPALGEMVIQPQRGDTFLDVTIDYFRELGWRRMPDVELETTSEPLATCSIRDVETIRIQPGTGALWDLPADTDITTAITESKGLLVIVTHDVHVDDLLDDPRPSRLFTDGNTAYCTWAELL